MLPVQRRSLLLMLFCAAAGTAAAQTPVAPDAPAKAPTQRVERSEIQVESLQKPAQPTDSPAELLGRKYAEDAPATPEDGREARVDINKVRVVTPQVYGGLPAERQAVIDADPYWFVTDKTRRQVMAELITGERELKEVPDAAQPE